MFCTKQCFVFLCSLAESGLIRKKAATEISSIDVLSFRLLKISHLPPLSNRQRNNLTIVIVASKKLTISRKLSCNGSHSALIRKEHFGPFEGDIDLMIL